MHFPLRVCTISTHDRTIQHPSHPHSHSTPTQCPLKCGLGPRAALIALSRSVKDDLLLLEFDIVPIFSSSSGPLTHLYTTSTSVTTTHPPTSIHQGVCLVSPMHTRSGFSVSLYCLVILQAVQRGAQEARHSFAQHSPRCVHNQQGNNPYFM
jgi:hypothetical protein